MPESVEIRFGINPTKEGEDFSFSFLAKQRFYSLLLLEPPASALS